MPLNVTPAVKKLIGQKYWRDKVSSIKLSKHFRILDSLVQKYGDKFKKGLKFNSRACRPQLLEPEYVKDLQEYLNPKRISNTTVEYVEKVTQLEKLICRKRGVCFKGNKVTNNTLKSLKIKTQGAEVGTKARIEACEDIRHMVSYLTMSKYADKKTESMPWRKANSDGTCFTVCHKIKDTVQVKGTGERAQGKSFKAAYLVTGKRDYLID
jgi:hypothetical protein